MSYDLVGYRARPGETPDAALERLEEYAVAGGPPSEDEWSEIVRVGGLLAAVDPAVETFVQRDAGFVEVSTPRFQVAVRAHEASVTIPYWTDGAEESFAEVDPYLTILQRAGFTLYDPQIEAVVEESSTVRDGYRASAEVALPVLGGAAAPPRASSGAPTARPRVHRWPFGRRKKED